MPGVTTRPLTRGPLQSSFGQPRIGGPPILRNGKPFMVEHQSAHCQGSCPCCHGCNPLLETEYYAVDGDFDGAKSSGGISLNPMTIDKGCQECNYLCTSWDGLFEVRSSQASPHTGLPVSPCRFHMPWLGTLIDERLVPFEPADVLLSQNTDLGFHPRFEAQFSNGECVGWIINFRIVEDGDCAESFSARNWRGGHSNKFPPGTFVSTQSSDDSWIEIEEGGI